MDRVDLKDKIEFWMKKIACYKVEIELVMITTKNEKARENLQEAIANLAKAYNMLFSTYKIIDEG